MKTWLTTLALPALTAAALLIPSAATYASSSKLYVDDDKQQCTTAPFTTIQAAVNAAKSGDTVYVCPGTYHESVAIAHKADLTIRNYVVKNQPAPLIAVDDADGFDVTESNEITISGLRITTNQNGIYADHSPKTEVRNTSITTAESGIVFDAGSDKSVAQGNTITGGDLFGIGFGTTTGVTVKQNTITAAQTGIFASTARKPTIEANSVTHASAVGIVLEATTGASVRKNTTNFAEVGLYLVQSMTNTISENTAKSNTTSGLYTDSDSTGNTLKKNLLQGNGADAFDESTGSKTAGTANSWSDNTCDTSTPADLCGRPATHLRAVPTPTPPRWPFHT